MALVSEITNLRPDVKGDKIATFDVHLTIGMSVFGMSLHRSSPNRKHWIGLPSTQYLRDGKPTHFPFLRLTDAARKELTRECLEMIGVVEMEPRLV
jgi:hypothetical protein